MTILAENPSALIPALDFVGLEAEIEAFITHPVPYELAPDAREWLRTMVRTTATACLLGELAELIRRNTVTAESVTAAIRAALAAGTSYQREQTRFPVEVAS